MNYPKLYWQILKYNVNRELQFRSDFWLSIFSRLVWFLMLVFFFNVLYRQILTINGWTLYESLLLLSIFQIIETTLYTFFISNFSQMPQYISEGDLDFLLLKPIDTQFFVSLRYFSLTSAINLIAPIILFGVALSHLHVSLSLGQVLLFLGGFLSSIVILYSLWFITVISLFWLTKIFEIYELFLSLFRFMQYPSSVYQGAVRHFFSFVFPIILTVTVPAQVLLGRFSELHNLVWLPVIAVITFVVARILWNSGLKVYSSASS